MTTQDTQREGKRMTIKDEALREYADLLEANGFAIYEPKGDRELSYFLYSQTVDGRECFGYVQSDRYNGGGRPFGGYSHTMPIKPSREHGSSMFVEALAKEPEQLTVEAARIVARPTNHNKIVGTQHNHEDASWLARGYVKRGAA